MENRPSLEKLRGELLGQGLPRAYVERLLAELDDHFSDFLEERSSTMGAARKLQFESNEVEQRLGEPARLAVFAAEQYHARSFWGRHPWLTFVFGPLPLLVLCWIASAIALQVIFVSIGYVATHAFGWPAELEKPGDYLWLQAAIVTTISWYAVVFPPLAVAGLMCRIARRNALSWRWPIVACLLLAFVAGCFTISYRLAVEPRDGQFMVGLGFSGSARGILLEFLPKFALALGIGLLLVKRAQQSESSLLNAG
jgi:hypothetical protein